ncbi:hypothetical protein LSAT2_032971 [Lamellibrachia satsuma]|nr:hypothetical protein LSAT2_032971 [Lamellibrachia satsuma]
MAANNYFGFPAGGAQYSAQPATAYPAAAPTAYVAQPAHQAAYATAAPRAAQSYDAYQTTHTAGQYAYATRTQVVVGATPAYESAKTYYAAAAAAPAAAAAVYTVAETPYQAYIAGGSVPITLASSTSATSPYVTTSYTAPTQQRQVTSTKVHTPSQNTQSYVYATNSAAQAPSAGSSYNSGSTSSSYDAALYSAATNYYQQQQTPKTGVTWQSKKVFTPKAKPKLPPKTPQLHYCEVCKISCAGPQTYREHLEGQKHKKKEVALKTGSTNPTATGRGVQTQLRCELCDVACTGADAYAAHIRGAKHQKVLKLHTKLGKPIPSTEPMVLTNSATPTTAKSTTTSTATASKTTTKVALAAAPGARKVVATPKITFVVSPPLTGARARGRRAVIHGRIGRAQARAAPVVHPGGGWQCVDAFGVRTPTKPSQLSARNSDPIDYFVLLFTVATMRTVLGNTRSYAEVVLCDLAG